jgi:hypothetical protein
LRVNVIIDMLLKSEVLASSLGSEAVSAVAAHPVFHNVRIRGLRHYLCCRIDKRAALKVRRMVSATASA